MRSIRQPILIVLLLGVGLAVPAFAQQPTQYPAPCDASKVTKADVDRAHTLFISGKQFLDESNYDKAISYFKDAYSIDCSVHGILPIIATAYERKGDKAEAILALEEYLKRAPQASDREVVQRRIANLKLQLAAAAPTTSAPIAPPPPPPVATTPPAPPPIPPRPQPPPAGTEPTATAAPSMTATTVPLSSGGDRHSIAPWVLVGVGVAAAITGVVLLGVGSGEVSSAAGNCPNHMCPMGDTSDVNKGNDGRTLEQVGGIVGGIGMAAVAGGLIWHFVEPTSPTTTGAAVDPAVGPGYAGVSLVDRF